METAPVTVLCLLLSAIHIASSQMIDTYELDIAGYILEHGKNITWSDDMKDPNHPGMQRSTKEICDRIQESISTVTGSTKQQVKCDRTSIYGHPVRGRLHVLFIKSQLDPTALDQDKLLKRVHSQLERISGRNNQSSGLVAGRVDKQWTTGDSGTDVVLHFPVAVYNNQKYTEWLDSYDSPTVLKGIEDTICPDVIAWANSQPDLTSANPRCSVLPPDYRHPVGVYFATFNTTDQNTLDQKIIEDAIYKTPQDPANTYDITPVIFRLRPPGSSAIPVAIQKPTITKPPKKPTQTMKTIVAIKPTDTPNAPPITKPPKKSKQMMKTTMTIKPTALSTCALIEED